MYPPYHLYVGDLAFWDLKVFICFLKGPYLGNIKVFFNAVILCKRNLAFFPVATRGQLTEG